MLLNLLLFFNYIVYILGCRFIYAVSLMMGIIILQPLWLDKNCQPRKAFNHCYIYMYMFTLRQRNNNFHQCGPGRTLANRTSFLYMVRKKVTIHNAKHGLVELSTCRNIFNNQIWWCQTFVTHVNNTICWAREKKKNRINVMQVLHVMGKRWKLDHFVVTINS